MGLIENNSNGGNAILLSVVSRKEGDKTYIGFGRRVKADTPGAHPAFKVNGEPVIDKNGNQVHRLEYRGLEGTIVAMEKREVDFGGGKKGRFLNVTISDKDESYVLSIDHGSRYWYDFCLRLPNVDFSKPVTLTPYDINNAEGRNAGISIKQGGQTVKRKWSKEAGYENGPPQPEQDEDTGDWQFGKRNAWVVKNVVDFIAASLPGATAANVQALAESEEADATDFSDDPTPF